MLTQAYKRKPIFVEINFHISLPKEYEKLKLVIHTISLIGAIFPNNVRTHSVKNNSGLI